MNTDPGVLGIPGAMGGGLVGTGGAIGGRVAGGVLTCGTGAGGTCGVKN